MFSSSATQGVFLALITFFAIIPTAIALPHFSVPQQYLEIGRMRALTEVDPSVLLETQCYNLDAHIVFHDESVAELSICEGGIAGPVQKCRGSPKETAGIAGTARFSVKTMREGATIEITKDHWEQCVRAARAVCPTGAFRAVCAGGASKGDIEFFLTNPW